MGDGQGAAAGGADWYYREVDQIKESPIFRDESGYAVSEILNASRNDMLSSFEVFQSQFKHMVSIMTALVTGAAVVVGFSLDSSWEFRAAGLGAAGVVLIGIKPLSWVLLEVLNQTYSLYVNTVIYAAQLHRAAGLHANLWFEWVEAFLEGRSLEETRPPAKDRQELYERWRHYPTGTWRLYARAVSNAAWVAVGFGLALLAWAAGTVIYHSEAL
jgi:hypothetical protein